MEKFKSTCEKCPEKGKIYELIKNKPVKGPRADRLRQMAKVQGIPKEQVEAKLSGEGGTLKLCASASCDIQSFKTDMELEAKMQELQLEPVNTTRENRMRKSQLIKIIKEEIQQTLQERQTPTLSTLAKIGNIQAADATAKYHSKTDLDTSRGLVNHYFKKGTPPSVLATAKDYIEAGAENDTQFVNFLKKQGISLNVKTYTANDLVRVDFEPTKQETTPAKDGQRPVVTTTLYSGEK